MSDNIVYYHSKCTIEAQPRLLLVKTVATPTTLEWKFSDGRTVSYPRDPIDIGNLTFSYRKLPNGKYFYKYALDNRLVQMIRVGEFDHSFGPEVPRRVGQPILRGPNGWIGLMVGWSPSWKDPVTRSAAAKYKILSDHLPGPLPLHVAGEDKIRDDFKMPFSSDDPWEQHLMQQIDITICQYGTSVDQIVIGPAFKPRPAEDEVRDRIHRSVELHGLEFLRPLNDANANLAESIGSVVPGTDVEVQILDCLKTAILVMIPDNPATPQILKARAARKARSRLAARGVASQEQAEIRLRSLRVAQRIVNIVWSKTHAARTPEHVLYPETEEQKQARLEAITKSEQEENARHEAITKSKVFATKWKVLAERLTVDEAYHSKLTLGIQTALKRLGTRIDTLHTAYDLKVSTEFCKTELVRECAANLAKIQGESVVGVHLSEEEASVSLSVENWQLIDKASYGPDNRRRFICQAGKHQLRADVWTDYVDEIIEGMSLQLAVQVVVRHQDGSVYPEMFESNNLLTLQLDERWTLGKTLLRYPSM